jgi:hypothetical protein
MYKLQDQQAVDLAQALRKIVRSAQTLIDNPKDSHYRLEDIVRLAQDQLKLLKQTKPAKLPTQRMRK